MKILYVTQANPDTNGAGWQRRAAQHLRALVQLGEVTIVLPNADPNQPDEHAEARVLAMGVTHVIQRNAMSVGEQTYHSEAQANGKFARLMAKARRLPWLDGRAQKPDRRRYRSMVVGKFDMIFAFRLQSALWIDSILDRSNRPPIMIADFDDIESRKFMDMQERNEFSLLGRIKLARQLDWIRSVERKLLNEWSAVCLCSDLDARRITEMYSRVTWVVPNAYTFGTRLPETDASPARLLFVGNFAFGPNVQGAKWFVQTIWPLVRAQLSDNVQATFAGFRPSADVQSLGNLPGIEIVADSLDLAPLYERANVVIVPILSGSGTRTKLIEAAAHGRAIVTTTVGCEGLYFQDGAHVEIADTKEMFAARVVKLAQDPVRRSMLADAAYAHAVKYFESEKIEAALVRRISELAAQVSQSIVGEQSL